LYRIKAVRDFTDVRAGEYGGYIENYDNLSQKDDCWVADEAKVYGGAKVRLNAWVYNNAEVCGKTIVTGESDVHNNVYLQDAGVIIDKHLF
jgi:carbonic anhydrase/acetyltransferase-like protein (isoleucine patch superfamily)